MNFNSSSPCPGLSSWTNDRRRAAALLWLVACFLACGKDQISLHDFRELPLPTSDDLSAAWFLDEKNGYLTGGQIWERGFILSTADGGETWQTDTTTANLLENLHFDRTGQGYACGPDGLLLFKKPGERHWQVARRDWRWYRACYFLRPTLGVLVGGTGWREGKIGRVGPDIWELDTLLELPNQLDAVWFSDSLTAHAVGQGWALRSADAGRSWARVALPVADFFHAVHFPTAEVGYLCGENGSILKTTDGGLHWQTLRDGNSIWAEDCPMRALWFTSADTGYIVGANGLFWRTTDGGNVWQQAADAPADADFTDVFVAGKRGWATAKGGRAFAFGE